MDDIQVGPEVSGIGAIGECGNQVTYGEKRGCCERVGGLEEVMVEQEGDGS